MEYFEDFESYTEGNGGKTFDRQVVQQAKCVTEKYYNLGYREGFFEAKAKSLQTSFDLGYYHGAIQAIKESLGILSAIPESERKTLTIEELNEQHESLKDCIIKSMRSTHEQHTL